MTTTPGTNITREGLFKLPPELRNAVYELVFADVEGNICIPIEGCPNANHKQHRSKMEKSKVLPENDEEDKPKLSLLLTCKQVYNEASSIAYSKMSMSLLDEDGILKGDTLRAGQHLASLMGGLQAVFGKQKLQLVRNLIIRERELLLTFTSFDSTFLFKQYPWDWDKQWGNGPLFDAFHHVRRLTICLDSGLLDCWMCDGLPKGESWLTPLVAPGVAAILLKAFPGLQEFAVRRYCGEQISKVIDGEIFAAESGLPHRPFADVMRELRERENM